MSNRVVKAMIWAEEIHKDQLYGDLPFTTHLHAVVGVLIEFGFGDDEDLLIAGWLHDAIEDQDVGLDEILDRFGVRVAALVIAVTDEPGKNRRERKAKTLPKTLLAGPRAVALKLADRIANIRNCQETGNQGLLKMYRKEHSTFVFQLRDDLIRGRDGSKITVMWEALTKITWEGWTARDG